MTTKKDERSPAAGLFKALKLPDLDTVGERLKWARLRAERGSAELSIAAGMSHGAVSRFEAMGGSNLEAATAFRLAAELAPGEKPETVAIFAWWLAMGYRAPTAFVSRRGRKPKKPAEGESTPST